MQYIEHPKRHVCKVLGPATSPQRPKAALKVKGRLKVLKQYKSIRFSASSLKVIDQANAIISEYSIQGFDLTLRQLYYQFVSRDLIANKQSEYKKLGSIINDGRLAGEISWEAIVDRTRNLVKNPHWEHPKEIVKACAAQFRIDKWEDQEFRVEVWIEKDALIGVIESVCNEHDVPFFSCRGYTSQSEMWAAGQRLLQYQEQNQTPIIIHLGDHDPSGIDMSRDIQDRLELFTHGSIDLNRIALNMDQVKHFKPPPNPAKITDSRATQYIKLHGRESWELDALEPRILSALIEQTILEYKDVTKWEAAVKRENGHKANLLKVSKGMK